jgi:hypothetical protein
MNVVGFSGGRALRACIASHHNVWPAAYKGLAFEAATAIASMTDAAIVAPSEMPPLGRGHGHRRPGRGLKGRHWR